MGSAQSTPSQAVRSQASKYSGLFQLTNDQSNTLKMISDLFEQLLLDKENNIFSLEQVLGSPDQCSALILILSNSLEKDFRTLHFPDPLKPDSKIQVSYMLQREYKELEKEPNRKSLCGTLIFFMIRLVTLVAALAASLQINRNIVNILDLVKYQSLGIYNKKFKAPVLDDLQKKTIESRIPIPANILEDLKKGGLKQLLSEDNAKPDPRNLYIYTYNENQQNTLVIDAESSIAYFAKGEKTTLYGLVFREIDSVQLSRIVPQQRPQYNFQRGQAQYNLQRGPGYAATGGRRKTKHAGRKLATQTRRKQKQSGGGALYSLIITKLFCTSGTACSLPELYMESDGTTYKVNDYLEKLRGVQLTVPNMQLQDRLQSFENESFDKIKLIEMKEEELDSEKFGPLSKVEKETMHYFQTIKATLRNKQEGTSPCFYRSFLLASRLDGNTLQTLICNDQWANRRVTSQVAYSLLQSLYQDRPDGTMDSMTAEECTKTLDLFSSTFDMTSEPGFTPTFDQLRFQQLPPEIIRTICQTQEKGGRSIREQHKMSILMNAHNNLHILFENHMKSCVELLLKMMRLETTEGYLSKPKIQLDPVFIRDPQGSLHALEVFIKEARRMLSSHYLQVESIYQNALKEIVNLSRGDQPPVEPGKNMLSVAANTLPNVPQKRA